MISNKSEEILESLWIRLEERKMPSVSLENIGISKEDPCFTELVESAYVVSKDGSRIEFTENGRKYGRDIVRRHRLAERLLADVLDVNGDLANEKACEFEHLLHKGIDDKICTLLGHPRLCPHGHTIPAGKCCEKEQTELKIVSPLSELSPGQYGKIAYIHTRDDSKLQKMMAIGVIPGMKIRLLQSFPSFLFELGNSQFAVDESIAREIFIRLLNEENPIG